MDLTRRHTEDVIDIPGTEVGLALAASAERFQKLRLSIEQARNAL
jgi:hypothetical protein